jgi:X-X-X-Leu-X-X-Gly heptad repeat protein
MLKKKTIVGTGAAFFAVPAAMVLACGPAFAGSSGDVLVSNTETIQAYLDASGHVDTSRVYEQVAMQGKGTVDLSNPVETNGLRNLDGFGGFQVKNGNMVGTYTVDGEKRLRSVSDYTKRLPLKVDVTYTLDGKTVEPGDVVGRSGILKVQYTVTNMTGQTQTVSFDDGTGKTTSTSEEVVIPIVGSLSTVLPSTFTDVKSAEANIAGDGRGGTKMSFTMTLFGPIGKPQATFGYEAKITDGVVPKASISALPVSPLDSPSFKGGADSYKGGAETGSTLTAGATEIDANLLKLRDGAGDLLAGLIKLRDGADQLNAGLTGQAAPGAKALAAGAGQLKDGTSQLKDGAVQAKDGSSQVADGAGQVADGAGQLDDGAQQVDDGAGQLLDGLTQAGEKAPALIDGLSQVADGLDQVDLGLAQLYGGIGELPAQAQPLHDGITKLRAGLGEVGTADTLIDGVDQVRAGFADATKTGGSLDQLKGGVDQSKAGVDQSKAGVDQSKAGVDQSKGGVDQSKAGVDQVIAGLTDALKTGGSIDQLAGGVTMAQNAADCGVACKTILDQVQAGVTQLRTNTTAANTGLGQVSAGLGQVSPGLSQVSAGLGQVSGGLGQVSAGLGQVSPGLALLKSKLSDAVVGLVKIECGMSNTSLKGVCKPEVPGLLQGLDALDAGVTKLVDGVVTKVQGGVGTATDLPAGDKTTLRGGIHGLQGGVDLIGAGGVTLIDGLYQLGDGAAQLKDGTGQLADGTKDLRAGAGQLADGADQLDSGLGDLSTGADQLDAGAGDLRTGADQLSSGLGDAADGSSQLSDGLKQAAGGAPKLKDGAQKLSDEGTKKLVAAGKSTAADYGQKYALIVAGAERAKTEGMAYGAPADAVGNTAYSYELAGADGEGGRNVGRGLGAVAAFGLAGGAAFLRRRFI